MLFSPHRKTPQSKQDVHGSQEALPLVLYDSAEYIPIPTPPCARCTLINRASIKPLTQSRAENGGGPALV